MNAWFDFNFLLDAKIKAAVDKNIIYINTVPFTLILFEFFWTFLATDGQIFFQYFKY